MNATATTGGEIYHNTIVVPSAWPADLLAQYPAGYPLESYGISSSGKVEITANTIVGATISPASNNVRQVGIALNGNGQVYNGNLLRYLDEAIAVTTYDYLSGSTHYIVGNTITENVVGLRFTGYHLDGYPTGPVNLTLRCNTFATAQPNGVGVWVMANTPFPASLGSSGTPNGNRFNDIADPDKRFVYDANTPFAYYRYNSQQEALGSNGNTISGLGAAVARVFQTQTSGTGACGTSTTPGVYARSVVKAPANGADGLPVSAGSLGEAYPNPATETVTFAYTLPAGTSAVELVIRDLMGRCVVRQPLSERAGKVSVSVQALPAGFYTGALETEGHRQGSHKLTVSH